MDEQKAAATKCRLQMNHMKISPIVWAMLFVAMIRRH